MDRPLHEILERWLSNYEQLAMRMLIWTSPVTSPVVAYAIVRIGVEAAATVHWTLGFAAAIGFVFLAEYLRRQLTRKFFEQFPGYIVVATFGISVMAAVSGFAAISYYLMHQQIATYDIRSDYSIGTFADYYVWSFFDMLPGLDVWKTLGVSSPATPKDTVAGLPVLLFRVFVLVGVFASYKAWREHKNARKSESAQPKDAA